MGEEWEGGLEVVHCKNVLEENRVALTSGGKIMNKALKLAVR